MGGKEKRVFRCNLLYNIAYIASVNQERRTRKSEFGNGKATAAWWEKENSGMEKRQLRGEKKDKAGEDVEVEDAHIYMMQKYGICKK